MRRLQGMNPRLLAAIVVAAFAASQARAADTSIYSYKGKDRQDKLVAAAKKEGAVSWYTSLAGPVVHSVTEAFHKKYPFINVSVYRAAENNVATRIEQETRARHSSADVVEVSAAGTLRLREARKLTPYYTPYAKEVPKQFKTVADNGLVWSASDRISPISFGYNKDRVPASAVPKKLDDYLNPALKDKLAIESSTTGLRWIGGVLHAKGDKQGKAFLAQFAKQNIRVEAVSGGALMGLVAQGEVGASPSVFRNHVEQQAHKGAHVDWTPVEPVVGNIGKVGIFQSAAHPAAAVLFADFLLGPDGGKVLKSKFYMEPTDHVSFEIWVPESEFDTTRKYAVQFKQWKSLLQRLFH